MTRWSVLGISAALFVRLIVASAALLLVSGGGMVVYSLPFVPPVPFAPDLILTKADSPDPVTVGANLTYTLTIQNQGTAAATGVTLTDMLPVGVVFVSAPGCTRASGAVICNLGTLTPSASAVVTITVKPMIIGVISNTASVTANETDANPADNQDSEDTTVEGPTACADIVFARIITGNNRDNELEGTKGNDLIFALGGDDEVEGKGGDDCIVGGEGEDELKGDDGKDVLLGEADEDKLEGGDGNDTLDGGGDDDKLEGEEDDDSIHGGPGKDEIKGGEGGDTLHGDAGADEIEGGEGKDTIFGGDGDDEIKGGEGNDTIEGQGGEDEIRGEDGDDKLFGGEGDDDLEGGDGDDVIDGGPGDDKIDGGDDDDTCIGGGGSDDFEDCELVSSSAATEAGEVTPVAPLESFPTPTPQPSEETPIGTPAEEQSGSAGGHDP